MNALYYDPLQEQIIDYVGGVRDIKKHVLRPVIALDTIFVEDPVRMLRAIKYSATTDAKMTFNLRHKIKQSASLLSQVSPSRITEELLKIINNAHASKIISEAIESDLFMYLQPSVSAMLYERKNIEYSFMENLRKLDELNRTNPEARLGKKLYFIIYDFITTLTDWKKETQGKYSSSELYAKTWTECRNFVLPMNPQRRELEYAVKSVMNSLGVQIRVQPKKS
jgi:poly(A) polymerase